MRWSLALAISVVVALVVPATAETRALMVGIDKYRNVPSLKGAVADARDINSALQRRGVPDSQRVLLLNEQATRTSVLGALDQIVASVKRDDLVIITFAGHGARERWGLNRPAGTEEGSLREVFLLGDFAVPNAAGQIDPRYGGSASERVAGTELNVRLRALHEKGARTIFVADTCHGGGLTRRPILDLPQEVFNYRRVPTYRFADGQDPLEADFAKLPPPVDTDRVLSSLTFLAAVDKTQLAPEVPIPAGSGQKRGALSYSFARIIEGQAPAARKGILTRGEIVDFIAPNIRNLTNNGQEPDLRPRAEFDRVVIDFTRDLVVAAPPLAPPEPIGSTVVVAGVEATEVALAPSGISITVTDDLTKADLIVKGRNIFSRSGDLVASNIKPGDIVGAAEREIAVRKLQALAMPRTRFVRLVKGDVAYKEGDTVVVEAPKSQLGEAIIPENYVMINVTGTGVVQYLYPARDSNASSILPVNRPVFGARVVPPFGADMIVLVTSPDELTDLTARLHSLNNRPHALEAVRLIEAAAKPGVRIGLQGIYTASGSN